MGVRTAVLVGLASAMGIWAAPSGASTASRGGSVPVAGDWEGTGSHGLPLSFALARRHGQLVATSIAVGAPEACPAMARNAEAVPLSAVAYSGPGAGSGRSTGSAALSGQLPGHGGSVSLTGRFTSRHAGTFSIAISRTVKGCGWPKGALTWQVHSARRPPVADRAWTAALTGPGIPHGTVKVVTASQGRVVKSFRTSFTCETSSATGTNSFDDVTAWDFIRPDGRFYSPTRGDTLKGRPVTWSGRISPRGALTGRLSIYDACTNRLVHAQFG